MDAMEEAEPEPIVSEPVKPAEEQRKTNQAPGLRRPHQQNQPRRLNHPEPSGSSVTSFLKGLLPQNFDTEDLIVVLLLLLMSGGSGSDQNAALLTLGIYLFM